jgi:hypothetical protein
VRNPDAKASEERSNTIHNVGFEEPVGLGCILDLILGEKESAANPSIVSCSSMNGQNEKRVLTEAR